MQQRGLTIGERATKIKRKEEIKIHYNPGLIVKICVKEVNYSHVNKALEQRPEKIIFTKNVRKIGFLAFKDVDCDRIDFSTAINLCEIGTKAFKNAKNIHWCDVLENANRTSQCFEDAKIIEEVIENKPSV